MIIPAIIQDFVDSTNLQIQSTTIMSPNNVAFQSVVVQSFSQAGPIPATAQLNDLTVSFDGPGGGNLITLSGTPAFTVSTSPVTLNALATVDNITAFADFNRQAINAKTIQWHLQGTVDVTAIVKTTVNLNKVVTLNGFDNFPIAPIVHSVNTTSGTPSMLTNVIHSTLNSVADINIFFGQTLHFNITSEGIVIGAGLIADAKFLSGPFEILANASLFADNDVSRVQLNKFLSNFSSGIPSTVNLVQFSTLDPVIEWLQPSLASMSLPAAMPGLQSHLLIQITLIIKGSDLKNGIQFKMELFNPEPAVSITMFSIAGKILINSTVIGTVNNTNVDIFIPPETTIETDPLPAAPASSVAAEELTLQLIANGGGFLNVDTTINLVLGEFPASVTFKQSNVPTVIET